MLSSPECDLPQRFLPANNSSVPFVASAHHGKEDLRARWAEDRAVKEAGFPALAVRACAADPRVGGEFALLISALNSRLLGEEWNLEDNEVDTDREGQRTEERDAVTSIYSDAHFKANAGELVIPLFSDDPENDLALHVLYHANHPYPIGELVTPMYLTSTSMPAYVRLHILAQALGSDIGAPGEGRIFGAIEAVITAHEAVQANGPPEMSSVMRNLLPSAAPAKPRAAAKARSGPQRRAGDAGKRSRTGLQDDRSATQVQTQWAAVEASEKYQTLLTTRKTLPAFGMKDQVIQAVRDNRVLVIVGNTGTSYTCDGCGELADQYRQVVAKQHSVSAAS